MFTMIPKPRLGSFAKGALAATALLLLAGCGAHGTIDAGTPGLFNHYVVFPLAWLLRGPRRRPA